MQEVQKLHCGLLVKANAVPAGGQLQCMIISLLLWSGFCLGLPGLWPLTSDYNRSQLEAKQPVSLPPSSTARPPDGSSSWRAHRRALQGRRTETNDGMINRNKKKENWFWYKVRRDASACWQSCGAAVTDGWHSCCLNYRKSVRNITEGPFYGNSGEIS